MDLQIRAAFFDLDNTLTMGDTLPCWLAALRGWPWIITAYVIAIGFGPLIPQPGAFDTRGRIKGLLLRLTVRDLPVQKAVKAGETVKSRMRWKDSTVAAVRQHHKEGHKIIVVTGAPSLYLPLLLKALPIDEFIATKLETKDGKLTGNLAGKNCVRAAKAELVKDWLDEHKPIETWGYGNAPHDLPMLALMDHSLVV